MSQRADGITARLHGRYGPGSETCAVCGWLLPVPSLPQVCARCQNKGVRLEPLSKIEQLFLAITQWRATRGEEPEQVFVQHTLYNHYVGRHLDKGKYNFDSSTPVMTLRAQLEKDAAAWRAAGCPI